MNPGLLSAELRAAAPGFASRLGAILLGLATVIAADLLRDPLRAGMITPLWGYLTRTSRRFTRLMSRLAGGAAPRPSRPGGRSGSPPVRLPTAHAWLLTALRHRAAVYTNQLDRLLSEPASIAIIAALPQAGSLLRPVARLLGLRHAILERPRPPRTPGKPRPRIASESAQPDRARETTRFGDAAPAAVPAPQLAPPPCPRARWPWVPRAPEPAQAAGPRASLLLRYDHEFHDRICAIVSAAAAGQGPASRGGSDPPHPLRETAPPAAASVRFR